MIDELGRRASRLAWDYCPASDKSKSIYLFAVDLTRRREQANSRDFAEKPPLCYMQRRLARLIDMLSLGSLVGVIYNN